jgi:hypothetical protein
MLALCSVATLRMLAQPVNVSVSPSSGSGASQTFSFTASSSGVYQNLAWMQVIFHYNVAAEGACYFYISSDGTAYISRDTGYTYGSGRAATGVLGSQVKFQHKTGEANPVSFTFAVTEVIP